MAYRDNKLHIKLCSRQVFTLAFAVVLGRLCWYHRVILHAVEGMVTCCIFADGCLAS
jgi:hypothetical protein